MPQQQQANKKKKKGHAPAHQNAFAYRHNPKSKLTAKILASPNEGVCKRCYDKIEWRKQYRKYKPLTQPATCNQCKRRNITAAYHTICDQCALTDKAWSKMILNADDNHDKVNADDNHDHDKVNANTEPQIQTQADLTSSKRKQTKAVCAMCTKSPAMQNSNQNSDIDTEIEEQIKVMEQKLNRPLKLRETKAIERKVIRAHEKEKERLKEERRRAREETKAVDNDDDNDNEHDNEHDDNDEEFINKHHLHQQQQQQQQQNTNTNTKTLEQDDDQDEEIDPFLQAIGGQDKLLTGEAYQQMILERERLANIRINS